jgi:hypothetical protein
MPLRARERRKRRGMERNRAASVAETNLSGLLRLSFMLHPRAFLRSILPEGQVMPSCHSA